MRNKCPSGKIKQTVNC